MAQKEYKKNQDKKYKKARKKKSKSEIIKREN